MSTTRQILKPVRRAIEETAADWSLYKGGPGSIKFYETFDRIAGYDNSWSEFTGPVGGIIDENSTEVSGPGNGKYVLRCYRANSGCCCAKTTLVPALSGTHCYRFYMRIAGTPGWPAENNSDFCLMNVSSTNCFELVVARTDGERFKTKFRTGAGTWDTLKFDPSLDTWYRIEIRLDVSDGTGTGTCSIYEVGGSQLGTTHTCNTVDTDNENIGYITMGPYYNLNHVITMYFDDLAIATNGEIGHWSLQDLLELDSGDSDYYLASDDAAAKTLPIGFATPVHTDNPKALRIWCRTKAYDADQRIVCPTVWSGGADSQKYQATDAYKEIYGQWLLDPADDTAWTWTDLDGLVAGAVTLTGENEDPGGYLSECWAEVIHGATGDAFMTHGPRFCAVSSTEIRVWVKVDDETDVKIRYGSNETYVKAGTGGDTTDTSATTLGSGTNYSHIFHITGLIANVQYYFDTLVQQGDDSWQSTYTFEGGASSVFWASLPKCKTPPTTGTDSDVNFCAAGDPHSVTLNHQIYHSINAKSPVFWISLGDEHAANSAKLSVNREAQYDKQGFHATALHFHEQVLSRMSSYSVISDHDHVRNNSNKFGQGDYWNRFSSLKYLASYNAIDSFRENRPMPDYLLPSDLAGTATGGSSSTLIDATPKEWQFEYDALSGGTPAAGDDITIGGADGTVLYVDATDSVTGTMICELDTAAAINNDDIVTDGVWTCLVNAGGGQFGFPTESKYGIYQGMMVHHDIQPSASDYSAGGQVKSVNGTTITLCEALIDKDGNQDPDAGHETFSSGDTYRIGRFALATAWTWDNVRFIILDKRTKRDVNGTPGASIDGIAYGLVNNNLSKDLDGDNDFGDHLTIKSVSGSTLYHDQTDLTGYIVKWDTVEVKSDGTTRGYGLIKSVTNSTGSGNNDGTVVIDWEISDWAAPPATNDEMYFYESGASDHGGAWDGGSWSTSGWTNAQIDAANINAGHVQRTMVEAELRDYATGGVDWCVLISETPLNTTELSGNDKWADFDGMTDWAYESSWTQEGGLYYASGYAPQPGAVIRQRETLVAPFSIREVANKVDLTDTHRWWYDSDNDRVYIYGNPTPNGTYYFWPTICVPEFWKRCAARKYITEKYESLNVIWLGADKHHANLSDWKSQTGDRWPTVAPGPLHCDKDKSHHSGGTWTVGGKDAYYDRGMGKVSGATPPQGANQIGCFSLFEVKNSLGKIVVSLFERDGNYVNNGSGTNPVTGRQWLGNLTMDINFITRVILSENLGITDALDWTKILPLQIFSEAVGVTDQRTWLRSMTRLFSEGMGVTDQRDVTQAFVRFWGDNEGIADSDVFSRVLSRYLSDGSGIADDVKGLIQIIKRLSESMGIADDLVGGLVIGRLLSDSLGLTDAKTRHSELVRMLEEAQGVTDSVASTASYVRALADSLPVSDIDHPAATFDRKFGDSLGLTDALVDALYLVIIKRISEAIGISDARLALRIMAHVFSDGIDITDARENFITIVRLFSELAGLSDGLTTAQDHGRKISDTAGITDMAKGLLTIIRLLSDTEGLSDSAIGEITAAIIERALSDSVGISDDAVETLFALLWRLISDNEGIEDSAEAIQTLVRRISELSVGITDAAAKSQTLIRALSDTQAVADAVAFTFTIIQRISDQVGISDRILGQILAYAMYKLYLAGSTAYMEVTPTAAELVALSLSTRDYMQFELETFDSEVAR